mmetsp:Transcript_31751/g.82853  ORF Transcript_31751/g.82853 Transcript_31751/m.82853 type:complete len:138 (+) Transcript_31751:188-601(+)
MCMCTCVRACLCRYVEGVYRSDMPATIGAAFMTKRLQMDGHLFRLQLWDTAGQERFRAMAPMYYRGASIAIIVFDVTDEDSFAEADLWVKELKDKCGTNDLGMCTCLSSFLHSFFTPSLPFPFTLASSCVDGQGKGG